MILDGESSYTVLGPATRLAMSLGLHRKLANINLPPAEVTQRRNAFWILYIFEKTISLRTGRPSLIRDDDIEIEPLNDDAASNTSQEASQRPRFSNHIKLIRIESEIYDELYSTRSRLNPGKKRLALITKFDNKLREWRESLPLEIQPEKPIQCAAEYVHVAVMLQFAYFNCVITLHRLSVYNAIGILAESDMDPSTSEGSAIHPQAYASHLTCLQAARNTAKLLKYFEQDSHLPRDIMR